MPERLGAPLFLVARFAEYYEEVAAIRLAIAEGRLGPMLVVGDEPPPTEPADLAARVSARLAGVIKAQRTEIARTGMPAEIEAHRHAAYAMAALTDEQLILETDWSGAEAWMDVLLEYRVFQSRNAGVHFFAIVDRLLESRTRDPLESELAAVLLLALRLGFKGRHRGGDGERTLHALRGRLFHLVERHYDDFESGPAFPQALSQLRADGTPSRLAPLTPWLIGLGVGLAAYLLVSSAIWLVLVEPIRKISHGG
jgi:type VI secretion system protein ImpK